MDGDKVTWIDVRDAALKALVDRLRRGADAYTVKAETSGCFRRPGEQTVQSNDINALTICAVEAQEQVDAGK